MVAMEIANKALWLKGLMKELGIYNGKIPLFCDSQCYLFGKESNLSCSFETHYSATSQDLRVAKIMRDHSLESAY